MGFPRSSSSNSREGLASLASVQDRKPSNNECFRAAKKAWIHTQPKPHKEPILSTTTLHAPLVSMAMSSSSSSSAGAQINKKIDTLPPTIAEKLPHVPESTEHLKEEAKEAGKKSLAGLRSLAAGGFGGICAVIVGHPFDLVKVRLQTAERGVYSSALDVVRKSMARDGLRRGLYAGVSAPLVGVTPMCMLSLPFNTGLSS